MSDTSARRCRTPDSMEQACILCRRTEADTDLCGTKSNYGLYSAHHFCLVFANDVQPQGTEEEGEMGFRTVDVLHASVRAAGMVCFVCGKRGPTIACQGRGCDRRFHLPCATEGGCVTRYLLPYSSFCWEHRPQQQELAAPEGTNCLICTNPVEGRTTYGTMVCPVCKRAWFHRACLQGQAMRAGAFFLQCPLCRNRKLVLTEMLLMGIRVPVRQASWEDNTEYEELCRQHGGCDARECLCPGGREEAQSAGPWQLFLCRSCAAVGTHRRCSNLGNIQEDAWRCHNCSGQSTAFSANSELDDTSTASQAASGQMLEPQAQESSSPEQMPSAQCHSCPVCEGSNRSSHPGPDRHQQQARCTRQTQTPYAWPGRWQERSRPTAARTVSNSRSQAVPRLSRRSTSRETRRRSTNRQQPSAASRGSAPRQRSRSNRAGGPMRVRDQSRVQRRAQAPYEQPRRPSQGSHTPAARAGRSPRRQAAPRLSQRSPARESHSSRSATRQRPSASSAPSRGSRAQQRGSASRSTGPVPVRDRSRSQHRAQTPNTRRRRRR